MRKLIAFFVVAVVAGTANQAFAQCATCAGSAPTFSQPVMAAAPQVYSAPAETYSAPVAYQSAPVEYAAPAPIEYSTPAPIEYGTPVVSSGCSSCSGGWGTVGGTVSGEMTPYSTQGLPPGAVVISDVVAEEGSSEEVAADSAVEGTVVESTSVMGSTEPVEPPAPEEDEEVEKLPAEGESSEGSDAKEATGDGT